MYSNNCSLVQGTEFGFANGLANKRGSHANHNFHQATLYWLNLELVRLRIGHTKTRNATESRYCITLTSKPEHVVRLKNKFGASHMLKATALMFNSDKEETRKATKASTLDSLSDEVAGTTKLSCLADAHRDQKLALEIQLRSVSDLSNAPDMRAVTSLLHQYFIRYVWLDVLCNFRTRPIKIITCHKKKNITDLKLDTPQVSANADLITGTVKRENCCIIALTEIHLLGCLSFKVAASTYDYLDNSFIERVATNRCSARAAVTILDCSDRSTC
mmetsp:Transcript_9122/g.17970  ORF Transcript_9122/g.17970 Transcript_9122/m.17970 type:complete len:274 (+) Transcript_9122:1252-2073(+)